MSLYRSLLAAVAALAFTMPAFADDAVPGSTDQAAQPTTDAAQMSSKVDINKATMQDLTKIKGISASKAKAIIAYRKKNGDFKTLEDLKNVKGFKKLNNDQLKDIQDQLTAG